MTDFHTSLDAALNHDPRWLPCGDCDEHRAQEGRMSARPFRHLCPEADERDAMTDDEFWQRVADNLTGPTWDDDDAGPDIDAALNVGICAECGEVGACAYDSEGRALIHATDEENDA